MYTGIISSIHAILIILFIAGITLCLTVYLSKLESLSIFAGGYLLAQFLLEALVYDQEIPAKFVLFPEHYMEFYVSPKALLYCFSAVMLLIILFGMARVKIRPGHIVVLVVACLWMYFWSMNQKRTPLSYWLFLFPYQVFTFFISVYALRNMDPTSVENVGSTHRLLILTAVFSLLILLEDTFAAFNMEEFIDATGLVTKDRNFCENIFQGIVAFGLIQRYVRYISIRLQPEPTLFPISPSDAEEKQRATSFTTDEAYKLGRMLSLSNREMDVLPLLLNGKTNQEISDELHISVGTVKTHVYHIFQKADVNDRIALFRFALEKR